MGSTGTRSDWLGVSCAIVDVAVILVSAAAGVGASTLTAYATYRLTARQDQRKWRAELAEKYALLAADQPRAAQALARQFAVGVLIIFRRRRRHA